jgi:hypothetical protein
VADQGTPTLGACHDPPISIGCYLMRGGRKRRLLWWTDPERPRGANRFDWAAKMATVSVYQECSRGFKCHHTGLPGQKSQWTAARKHPEADAVPCGDS